MSKPTTGPRTLKPYQCVTCGHEAEFTTNHWGGIYNTDCKCCGNGRAWVCTEEMPKEYDKPEPWTLH